MPATAPDLRIGAAYIRVSTDDQVEYSPASQLVEIRKYPMISSLSMRASAAARPISAPPSTA